LDKLTVLHDRPIIFSCIFDFFVVETKSQRLIAKIDLIPFAAGSRVALRQAGGHTGTAPTFESIAGSEIVWRTPLDPIPDRHFQKLGQRSRICMKLVQLAVTDDICSGDIKGET
tara:strand:- start:68 stop:409 length:342 start_codon:yes stop_codon:yes gene_type:complete